MMFKQFKQGAKAANLINLMSAISRELCAQKKIFPIMKQ